MSEESEIDIESGISRGVAFDMAPRVVHPRYAKTSACKDQEAIELCIEGCEKKNPCSADAFSSEVGGQDSVTGIDQHSNSDECLLYGMEGTLLCCDRCPSSYHARCIGVSKMHIPVGAWYFPECRINELEPKLKSGTTLKGAKLLGVDSYGHIFLGACGHLLVLKALSGSNSIFRYYNEN